MIRDAAAAAWVHTLFEYGGITIGVMLYRHARATQQQPAITAPGSFAIIVGLLLGAAIGNKLVFFIEEPAAWSAMWLGGAMPGQSIVGGLLGGLVGVEIAKRLTRQPQSTGDLMVMPLAAGIVVGRIGCFFAGLHDDTYGMPTRLPWGVDFGDGIPRHATQLYEIGFIIAFAGLLHAKRPLLAIVPGLQFKLFLSGYLVWRLMIDSLKPPHAAYPLGLSGIQWVCLIALLLYAPFIASALNQLRSPRWVLRR